MHSTPHARLALACLLALLGTLVMARMGEARFRARAQLASSTGAHARPSSRALPRSTPEGNALCDGGAIDPNFATPAELELLPGVGPRLAREIVALRERVGPFRTLSALRKVRGIGAKTLAKMAPLLQIDLERLEHAAQSKRDVGRAQQLLPIGQEGSAQVDAADPAPRQQVVDTEHDVAAHP
ncbi:MAG: helix-hairpin-helix motif [Myxococcaceae bacterium]|nr:helix-hairpin-helix motif [Myxococcaceae bacterium]